MMNKYETDDTFLARWIAGELTDAEISDFKKTKAYKQFDIINKEVQLLEGPDIDTEIALIAVKQKLKANSKKVKVINLWKSMAAAAVVIFGISFYLSSDKSYTTSIGETQIITLADGSEVHLNANSSLTHKRFFWDSDKQVALNGEAYFVITKGDDFKVNTNSGVIAVLGTEFNVKDRNAFELKCYEGKVSFTSTLSAKSPVILTEGMLIKTENNSFEKSDFVEKTPSWRNGMSTFKDSPLSAVLEELTNYFPVEFETNSVKTDRLYTGSFSHGNLDIALKSTLAPMGINYKQVKNKVILSE